jgi:ABC-2 type transport system ATP-binding protein
MTRDYSLRSSQKLSHSNAARGGLEPLMTASQSNGAPLRASGLHRSYGSVHALRGLDLEVKPGEIVCLLGPNGAGKSTAIRCILGFESPDQGTLTVSGGNPRSRAFRPSYVPQMSEFPAALTVDEILSFVARHYVGGYSLGTIKEAFSLSHLGDRRAALLSGGQKRCVSMAAAFIGTPKFVVMDEPTVGVDLDARKRAWEFIRGYTQNGGSVLFTTHIMEEAESMSQRIVILNLGRKVIEGSVAEIQAKFSLTRIELKDLESAPWPQHLSPKINGERTIFWLNDSDSFVRETLSHRKYQDLRIRSASLEEILSYIYRTTEGSEFSNSQIQDSVDDQRTGATA